MEKCLFNFFNRHLLIFILFIIYNESIPLIKSSTNKNCQFFGFSRSNGEHWVLNCLSERGTIIPLGTFSHFEDGIFYSCRLHLDENFENEESNISSPVPECDFLSATGRSEFVRGLFIVSCTNDEIIGCIDVYGDLVHSGQLFVYTNGQLRKCVIYGRGRWAKTERLGCFNGSREDDPENRMFHVPFGRRWQNGNFELRCNDNGINIYKCIVDGNRIHEGTAWIDREGVLNVCE